MYTKQDLIQAFCVARRCMPKDLKNIETDIQNRIDVERQRLTAELNALPVSAKAEMKRIALEYLAMQVKQEILTENAGVEL